MVKLLVLGIDGLDYFLTKRFRFKNLLQECHQPILLKEFPIILTHTIWASIISGKLPEEHGITTTTKWENQLLQKLNELLSRGNKILNKNRMKKKNINITRKMVFISKILSILGFKKSLWEKLD